MVNQHLTDHLTKGQGPFKPPSRTEHDALLAERDALHQRVADLEGQLARLNREFDAYLGARW